MFRYCPKRALTAETGDKSVEVSGLNDKVVSDDALARYEEATRKLAKKEIGGKKYLSTQEKLKIAAVELVSEKEAEETKKLILRSKIYGFTGLFVSLMGLTAGITLFLI